MASETVTVLFNDLVGSTELLSRVGEARADELRRELFALLREATEASGGREVKSLGDGSMVAFDGVAGGLACAVAMQQAVAARPQGAEPLAIRVGLAVGEADAEGGDYFGLPVVEAARLCAAAVGGEILTTGLMRTLARSRSEVVFEPVGSLDLKGLEDPVETWRVAWAPLPARPVPGRLISAAALNFVGRHSEHEQLAMAWKAVESGVRRVMLLSGEPGIGKTSLSARFATEVAEAGATVLYGRCDEDLAIPYQPWIEALTQLVAHAPEPVLVEHVAERGAHLVRLVPELGRRVAAEVPTAGDRDTERFVLFGCVADLLARVGQESPVLVVLDDLHWADRPTVQLLRHVISAEPLMRVGVLGTFRDSEVSAGHVVGELLAALHREQGVERFALRGLTDLDLLELLERVAGHEMTEQGLALRDAVLAETAGNPFFVVEILRHLSETGAIYQGVDGSWTSDADLQAVGLPISVKEVIGRRVAALGVESERVLAMGAVIGREFDVELLAAAAKVDDDVLIDLCDAAVVAAVLQRSGAPDRYTFSHALIEHTLYEALSPARRARAHRVVAEQLEVMRGGDPGQRIGELARHWAAAVQPTDTGKALHYAALAGARALAQLAPDEALRWYERAIEYLDREAQGDPRRRAEILIGLGDAQKQCGLPAHRETLLEAARIAEEAGAADLIVRSALTNNRGAFSIIGGVDHERIEVISRALAQATAPDDPDRARLLALASSERIYDTDLEERVRIADEAVGVARRSGDGAALVDAVTMAHAGLVHPSTLERRIPMTSEACRVADDLPDPARRFAAHSARWLNAIERGDGRGVIEHHARLDREVRLSPHATHRWQHLSHSATMLTLRGDLAGADAAAEAALALGMDTGQPDAMTQYAVQVTVIRVHQGRLHEMVPVIEQAIIDVPALVAYQAALAYTSRDGG